MDCPSSLVGRCQTESMLSPFVLVRFQLHLTLISSLFAYEKDFLVRLTPDLATSRIKVACCDASRERHEHCSLSCQRAGTRQSGAAEIDPLSVKT
ncbi:hypothetical protein RRG08_032493 [Elysia crispata]|uniref:Uncharacterized protein n=1 Tax=Elysia crispata TaxID=231223 RepID=A0AAE1DPW5_9GAST|nr:hypothetical protein RRG08_032493 [Elysia crispata]